MTLKLVKPADQQGPHNQMIVAAVSLLAWNANKQQLTVRITVTQCDVILSANVEETEPRFVSPDTHLMRITFPANELLSNFEAKGSAVLIRCEQDSTQFAVKLERDPRTQRLYTCSGYMNGAMPRHYLEHAMHIGGILHQACYE